MYVVRSCRIGGTSIPSSRCKSKKVVSLKDRHIHQPQTCWTLKNPMNVSHLGATSKRWCWTHGSLRPFCGVKEVNDNHLTQPLQEWFCRKKTRRHAIHYGQESIVLLNKTSIKFLGYHSESHDLLRETAQRTSFGVTPVPYGMSFFSQIIIHILIPFTNPQFYKFCYPTEEAPTDRCFHKWQAAPKSRTVESVLGWANPNDPFSECSVEYGSFNIK